MIFAEKFSPTLSTLKLLTLILTIPPLLTACSTTPQNTSSKASSKNLYLVSHPPKSTLTKIDALLPATMKWYDNVAKSLYHKGRVLTAIEKKQAKQLGVRNPNTVRVVILDKFPEPNGRFSNDHSEGARAMGDIIMLKPHLKNNSMVLCHELVHVAQKDRLGLRDFLKQIALEKEILGYSGSLLENEAYALQQTIQ